VSQPASHQQPINFADLPDEAFIRPKHLLRLQLVPFSATTLWRKCRQREFPQPIKVSAGITAWRVGDVRKYLDQLNNLKSGGVR
jgi:prophage regulatory protein